MSVCQDLRWRTQWGGAHGGKLFPYIERSDTNSPLSWTKAITKIASDAVCEHTGRVCEHAYYVVPKGVQCDNPGAFIAHLV